MINFPKYSDIKQFKNKHPNSRCFIVCTGPSLTIEDLDKIKDEICFGMNSIVKVFPHTTWRPTYYGIGNTRVIRDCRDYMNNIDIPYIFVDNKQLIKKSRLFLKTILFPMPCMSYLLLEEKWNFKPLKFSDNAYAAVYFGYTIAYCLMQIAVYMGFNEIYLLGADCDYAGENSYSQDLSYAEDLPKSIQVRAGNNLLIGHASAKKYADEHGIKIYNATRGGKLEVYERIDLDEILKQK